ncbi:eukaryotic translation initiation factor 4 gamma 2, partial [Patella vulgata]|uniref:eukaryotic translation initiation factor 4 gamma 2 n=1 Tax=Patella vulgata TaxID=6465 RepID=UPI0024A7F0DC
SFISLFFPAVNLHIRIIRSSILDAKIGKGGASPRSGGRDVRPPTTGAGAAANRVTKSRWIPPSSIKRDANHGEEKYDQIFRRVRGILNKLSPEKFDKLSLELLNVGIDSQVVLKGIILLIFEKALDEVKYSSLYAQLCQRLCDDAPNFEPPDSNITTFRRLLLNKCQDEFENRSRASEAYDKRDGPLTDEEAEQYHLAKWKMLGNIKFIGELGKLQMLHEGILHKCIKQLLEKKRNTDVLDMAEDLECLCQIMRTVGPRLDTSRAKAWMDQYFERIKYFAGNSELPPRIRFMLQDVVELRAKKWKPRLHAASIGPKTITEIRQHAAAELGVFIPPHQNRMSNMIGNRAMNGGLVQNMKGGMGDLFSAPANSMNNMIGTGPGVISLEANNSTYNNGMGRNRNHQNQGYQNNYQNRRQQDGGSPRGTRQNNQQNQQGSTPYQQQNQQKQAAGASGSRDLPPRFQRMAVQQPPTTVPTVTTSSSTNGMSTPPLPTREEVSLRPVKNFNFKPNTPKALPKSAQTPPNSQGWSLRPSNQDPSTHVKPIMTIKQEPLPIKQIIVQDKNKTNNNKKGTISKEELLKIASQIGTEYLAKENTSEAIALIKEANVPRKMLPLIISRLMIDVLEKEDDDREYVMKFITAMKEENMINSEHFMEGFKSLMDQLPELEKEVQLVKSYTARFGAMAVTKGLVSLAELAEPLENGVHYPLFMLCLQQIYKIKDKDWLLVTFTNSKLDLQTMLPELDQKRERLLETLEDRGLSFLFPLMKIQSELGKQIQLDPTANSLFKWIKDRVDNNMQKDPRFINILTTSVVKYVAEETTLSDTIDKTQVPDKMVIEKEKECLDKLKLVLQMFLRDHMDLNIVALYAVQVFCHQNGFPKGMLLRFFMNFYDMEIVEEEAFLKWKEEVNDQYPGKGKALFQVNQWLTWLEQAEEESEEESEDE